MRKFRTTTWVMLLAAASAATGSLATAQDSGQQQEVSADVSTGVSAEAQAVLDRMTEFLRAQESFSIDTQATRDEIVAFGYKLQNNERSRLTVRRPDKLRMELAGDIRNRTFVYDGAKLVMYSPDDSAYTSVAAPDSLARLIGGLLDAGVEMPLIDVLYHATAGTIAETVRGGILVGQSTINGIAVDHLAFRQADADWQLWVEQGERALPRKMVITTRYAYGDPQYQALLDWNLKPKIDNSTFTFVPPKGAVEVEFAQPEAIAGQAP